MSNKPKKYGITQMQVSTLIYRQMPTHLTIYEKMILLAFANRYRDGQSISISLEELVIECSTSKRSVGTYIKSLEQKGFIYKHRVGLGENNRYSLDLDAMEINIGDFRQRRENVVQLVVNQ